MHNFHVLVASDHQDNKMRIGSISASPMHALHHYPIEAERVLDCSSVSSLQLELMPKYT